MKQLLLVLTLILLSNSVSSATIIMAPCHSTYYSHHRIHTQSTPTIRKVSSNPSAYVKFRGSDYYSIQINPKTHRGDYVLGDINTKYYNTGNIKSIEKGWSDKFPTIRIETFDGISEVTWYYKSAKVRDRDFLKVIGGY